MLLGFISSNIVSFIYFISITHNPDPWAVWIQELEHQREAAGELLGIMVDLPTFGHFKCTHILYPLMYPIWGLWVHYGT